MLYLGGFPVVKKSSIDEAYTGLPVWIVDSYVGSRLPARRPLLGGSYLCTCSVARSRAETRQCLPVAQVGRRHARARKARLRGVYEEAVGLQPAVQGLLAAEDIRPAARAPQSQEDRVLPNQELRDTSS